MPDTERLKYDETFEPCRVWIKNQRRNKRDWESIRFGLAKDEAGLIKFLKNKYDEEFWSISLEEWYCLVEIEKFNEPAFSGNINKKPEPPTISAPTDPYSCWQKYKEKLKQKKFSYESILNIETSVKKIVSQLSQKTEQYSPVRGIVVGNVQSGKTANMAGVIAMAADYGYNFFIILSGTIDNLREQTRKRLIDDLNSGDSILHFDSLDYLSSKTKTPHRLQDLHLGANHKNRYLTVCLKNSTRLRDLINWINMDPRKKNELKVLVIDDESDQAGVNTANVSKKLKTTINKLIYCLVFGKNSRQGDAVPYQCMNYIGYTATPYANFLNEATDESLYPKDFIATLNSPSDYNGPQQIFGIIDQFEPLPVVRKIDTNEIEAINSGKIKYKSDFPEELKKSLYWFLCTVAFFRFNNLSKPVSMLIHTSQKISKHAEMENLITSFFENITNVDELMSDIKKIYEQEVRMMSIEKYKEIMCINETFEDIKDYPKFEEISSHIYELINIGIQHIKLNEEENKLEYTKGIHLCVDNCANSANEENIVMRLIYPDKEDKETLKQCPAFIVIGGSTLSRGLTIEGLTTSYFLRTTSTADTLMQMGRWFGYRKKYELLPRIWMSKRSIDLFERLSQLDFDLREELHNMEILNLLPSEYGPRLDSFPDFKLLKITSKNKMQSAYEIECSYSNKSGQITKYFNNKENIRDNYEKTYKFINQLGKPDVCKNNNKSYPLLNNESFMWCDQDYIKVLDFLSSLKFPEQKASINDLESLKNWYKIEYENENLSNWNIIVSGIRKGTKLSFQDFDLYLPTRRKLKNLDSEHIYLKAITSTDEKISDINCDNLSKYDLELLKSNKYTQNEKRVKYGDNTKPLLILYIIDKDSGKDLISNDDRIPLDLENHLVGYYIYIPYGCNKNKLGSANKVTVKLQFDTKGDIDDED